MRWLVLLVGTLIYWFCAVSFAALLIFLRGDCWAGATPPEVKSCVETGRYWAWFVLALCLIVFPLYAARLWKGAGRS